MVSRLSASAVISILALLLSTNSFGQNIALPKDPWTQPNTGMIDTYNSEGDPPPHCVQRSCGLLDRQAIVKLSNKADN
jgi:hypothetical protein